MLTVETPDGTLTIDPAAGLYSLNDGEPEPIPAEWAAWVSGLASQAQRAVYTAAIRRDLARGIAGLRSAMAVAKADKATATAKATAEAFRAAAAAQRAAGTRAWVPTASTATDLATLKAKVVADLAAIREQVAIGFDSIATLAGGQAEMYSYRAINDAGFELNAGSTAGLARIVANELKEEG